MMPKAMHWFNFGACIRIERLSIGTPGHSASASIDETENTARQTLATTDFKKLEPEPNKQTNKQKTPEIPRTHTRSP